MFGYVNINKNELPKERINVYQSYYCGLCHELKAYGMKGQMLLNYDMTFLVVLLSGLYELPDDGKEFLCPMHPAKKRVHRRNEATAYAADMNVLLSYESFADDWNDDHSHSKHLMMKVFRKDYDEIFAKYPRQAQALKDSLEKLEEAEKRYESNVDIVAGYTGEFLAEIFAWKDEMWAEDLRCLGFYLGKFIYIMDAYEDLDKDVADGRYNVLREVRAENPEEFDTIVRLMLVSMMSEASKAFERLPILENADILRNILYSGVWNKYEFLLAKKNKKEKQ